MENVKKYKKALADAITSLNDYISIIEKNIDIHKNSKQENLYFKGKIEGLKLARKIITDKFYYVV